MNRHTANYYRRQIRCSLPVAVNTSPTILALARQQDQYQPTQAEVTAMKDIVTNMHKRLAEIDRVLPADWEALVAEREQISGALALLTASQSQAPRVSQDRASGAENGSQSTAIDPSPAPDDLSQEAVLRAIIDAGETEVPTRVIREAVGIEGPRLTAHLNGMLAAGLLAKRGERRGTTYRLTAKARKLEVAA